MRKITTLSLLSLAILLSSCNTTEDKKPESEDDKLFYTIGTMLGQRLKTLSPSEAEVDMIVQGVKDSSMDRPLQVKDSEYHPKVQKLFRDRMKQQADKSRKAGAEYLEEFVASGGTKTKSGMAFKIIKEGNGPHPKATDLVRVHYHGTLIDGKVFDSSIDRGDPINFPLNQVIKCWTEGVQKLKKGGKGKLVCPPRLAYGDAGAPPRIPGGSTLVFDVELVDILPPPKKGKTGKKKGRKKK